MLHEALRYLFFFQTHSHFLQNSTCVLLMCGNKALESFPVTPIKTSATDILTVTLFVWSSLGQLHVYSSLCNIQPAASTCSPEEIHTLTYETQRKFIFRGIERALGKQTLC